MSQLGYAIWEYFTVFFDYIPKVMYFLYAALASALDAMQCLMRKLAGLDTYYMGPNNTPVKGTDPVLSFIFGVLGIGEDAAAYSPLTTVFWSMAIFGLIVLVLTTMVAIIKSHYQEDSAKTSPVQYVYTALKSIFTFAITPAVVICGFWLSSFLLQTLDNITAGGATAEKLAGIYGPAASKIEGVTVSGSGSNVTVDGSTQNTYTRYDFFGFGTGSTSETFSGLLFKTAAYDANRVRAGTYKEKNSGGFNFGNADLFGTWRPNGADWQSHTAYQIDYAFANNLNIEGVIYAEALYLTAENGGNLITIANMDAFAFVGVSSGFSKYNVGLVWYYYNLWKFNFMVGFIAVVTCFSLLFGIILGLMTRIIKSVALFLIYPGVLGLAPLDEWGAFKKWRTEFMQQALMAFGAIIGMNIFFLILPFLSEIKFFNFVLIDYMVNIVIIVAGLAIVKQFIAFMSGLIGGADASATGEGIKKDVTGKLATGAKMTLGAANVALKAGKFLSPFGAAGAILGKATKRQMSKNLANEAADNAAEANAAADAEEAKVDEVRAANDFANAKGRQKDLLEYNKKLDENGVYDAFKQKALSQGMSEDEANKFADQEFHKDMMKNSEDYRNSFNADQAIIDNQGYSADELKAKDAAARHRNRAEEETNRMKMIRRANYFDENTGEDVPEAATQMLKNEGKAAFGAIQKAFFDNIPKNLGLNIGAIAGVFTELSNNQYDEKGAITGTYGAPNEVAQTQAQLDVQKQKAGAQRRAGMDAFLGSVLGWAPGQKQNEPAPKGEKAQLKASENIDAAATKIAQASESIIKQMEKFNNAISKMPKK